MKHSIPHLSRLIARITAPRRSYPLFDAAVLAYVSVVLLVQVLLQISPAVTFMASVGLIDIQTWLGLLGAALIAIDLFTTKRVWQGPYCLLLYGILLLMVISFALNKMLLLGTSRTEVKIVSPQSQAIRDAILSKVDRGVTMLHGEGGYLHQQTELLLSVVSNHELPKIEQLARGIDPDCFMIVTRVTEVWGRGFTYSNHYAEKTQ